MSQGTQLVKQDTSKTVGAYFQKNLDKLKGALTNTGLTPERMVRVAVNAIAKSPDLQKCSQVSLIGSILQSAALGLEPNTPLQEAALIPYGNTCTFQPMYRGLIKLARKGGVTEVYAEVIKEKDKVQVFRGLENNLVHEIHLGDRGKAIAFYAVFKTADGGRDYEIMTIPEIEAIRGRSQAAKSGKSPWQTDFDEMAKKTVLKRLLKRAPLTVETARAMEVDNEAEGGAPEKADFSEVLDDLGLDAPAEPTAKPEVMDSKTQSGTVEDMRKRGMVILGSLDAGKATNLLRYLGWLALDEDLESIGVHHLEAIAKDEKSFRRQVEEYANLEAAAG
jgi:recombination protein RecT